MSAWTPAPLCRINCPFFLSGYYHKRGADGGGALALVYGEGRLRCVTVALRLTWPVGVAVFWWMAFRRDGVLFTV